MADVKISGLPASSVPLAGTEVLPIVQGGQTRQVSIANVTAGRAISATTIQSTVATGTAPLTVASTTEVANLKAANATSADTANQVKSNTTSGVLQIVGPAAAATRVMTTPDANFTAARTDAGQTFTGMQVFSSDASINGLTVGKGTGSISDNSAFGGRSLEAITSGTGNTGVGYLSLLSVSTGVSNSAVGAFSQISGIGNRNTSVGYSSLNNVSGNDNTALGNLAGGAGALSGEGNTFVGSSAGRNVSTGFANSFFGRGAGRSTTTGYVNVAIGAEYPGNYGEAALETNTTGIGNVAIGNSALRLATSNYNVAIGLSAGTAVTTGNALTYIGALAAGSATTNTNEIVIGYSAVGNGSNTTTIGNGATTNTVIPAGNVTATNGNFVVGTSGKGIDFSATAGTGTSELLSDYEEGDWVPTDASGAGLTLTVAAAYYTKVGRVVTLTGRVTYPVNASAVQARITCPFATIGPTAFVTSTNFPATVTGYANGTSMYFYIDAQGAISNQNASTAEFNISFTYITT
jgi:hypothetical protein